MPRSYAKPTMATFIPPFSSSATRATLVLLVAVFIGALAWHGPIAQPAHYHDFADRRIWLGIPNAVDVLSNLAFLLAGAFGLAAAMRLPPVMPARAAWGLFFASVMLTTAGSTFYHWAPDTLGLAVDRLPIAWACAWLTLALLAERVDGRAAHPAAQSAAFVLASLSVWLWYRGEVAGLGDLRAYLFMQFLPVLLIPLVCALFRGGVLSIGDWVGAIGLYLMAKLFEIFDARIFDALGMVSGHTLKHLIAAMAALWLAQRLATRAGAIRAAQANATRLRQATPPRSARPDNSMP